ncbi:MAG: ROK family protein [Pseudomonadota bacterium]
MGGGEPWLVLDIGGTTLRAGAYHPDGDRLLAVERGPAPSFLACPGLGQAALRARLVEELAALAARLGLARPPVVSAGFPGPVNAAGWALRAPTLWGPAAEPTPLAERLAAAWPGARVLVANDMSAAGCCFQRTPDEDFCVVTVSSGIGHKLFLGGRPVVGRGGRGGELGHLRVDFSEDAPLCDCGGRGHLGALASGRATAWQAARRCARDPVAFAASSLGRALDGDVSRLDNTCLAAAFREGDPWAAALVAAMAAPLGRALAAVHVLAGVERFVLMGGFAHALGPGYRSLLAQAAAAGAWDLGQDWATMIEPGVLGDDAGLLGAGRLARSQLLPAARPLPQGATP